MTGVVVVDLRRKPRRGSRPMRGPERREAVRVLLLAQNYICAHCEDPVDPTILHPHKESPTIEHVLPRSLGGRNNIENLLVKHQVCNEAAGARPPSPQDRRWQLIVRGWLRSNPTLHHFNLRHNRSAA
jgi:5-methylcytosine-specific restriction endonuclease McrA